MLLGAIWDVRDRTEFFLKNPHQAKMTKNGRKWYEEKVFGLFREIKTLVCLKMV